MSLRGIGGLTVSMHLLVRYMVDAANAQPSWMLMLHACTLTPMPQPGCVAAPAAPVHLTLNLSKCWPDGGCLCC